MNDRIHRWYGSRKRGNYIENPILDSHVLLLPLSIEEASTLIMSSMQGKHRLPTRLYTKNQGRQLQKTSISIVCVCSPALLHSYNIINNVFVQIWKHPCKGSGKVLISKTFNVFFKSSTDSTTFWCSARWTR